MGEQVDARDAKGVLIGDHGQVNNYFGVAPTPRLEIVWPVQVGRPPARAAAFQPRAALVAKVWTALTGPGPTVLSQVVASGGGGVGKTQLAAAVFAEARNQGKDLLLWVTATSRESVLAAYARAAAAAGVDAPTAGPADQAAERFLEWLATTDCSWFVVLDDVAEPADLDGLWPEGRAGMVLLTSRRRDLGAGTAVHVPVDVFSPEEAVAHLAGKLAGTAADPGRSDALDQAGDLAAELGYLPVALAQAGAVIALDGTTCAAYRRRLADRTARLDELLPAHARPDTYAHTVASTWELAVDRADELPPRGLARKALEIAAVLDPNGIPDAIWSTEAVIAHAGAASADEMRRALRNLHRLSLITHDPNGGPQAVRIHALVQRAVADRLGLGDRLTATVQTAADALVDIWPDPESSAVSDALRRNARTLAGHGDALWAHGVHPALFRVIASLRDGGLIGEAHTYGQQLVEQVAAHLGPDHLDTLDLRNEVAHCLGWLEDYGPALTAYQELVEDYTRVVGPDDWRTLNGRGWVAMTLGGMGRPKEALAAIEALVPDYVRVLGPYDPSTLSAREELAYRIQQAGDAAAATAAFDELVADLVRAVGRDDRQTLRTRRWLARARERTDEPGAVTAAYEELVADYLRVYGPDDPDTLLACSWAAAAHGATDGPAAAVEDFQRLVEPYTRVYGPDHPKTLEVRNDLANWQWRAGDRAVAIAALAELVDGFRRVLGPDHPQTVRAGGDLARWREALG